MIILPSFGMPHRLIHRTSLVLKSWVDGTGGPFRRTCPHLAAPLGMPVPGSGPWRVWCGKTPLARDVLIFKIVDREVRFPPGTEDETTSGKVGPAPISTGPSRALAERESGRASKRRA
jgi:hypothetical protein